MARKSTDIGELARALKAPAFVNRDSAAYATELDPVSPTTLVLSLTEIKPYEHNPRHTENPEFDRLKDSIASRRGLTTPLTVTKRPGDTRYTIAAGGNSRLQALNELYQETADEAFNRVICQFEPWDSDCRVLANHLIENDVRGNMTFADKARAVVEWQRFYRAAHLEERTLSQRALEVKLGEAGVKVNQALLSRYLFTAEFLLPMLPQALESGLGRPQIEELIRLWTFAQQYWDEVPLPEGFTPTGTLQDAFAAACTTEDRHCDDWDFDIFQAVLATHIAEALKLDPKVVALDLDSLYHGIPVSELGSPPPSPDDQPQWAFERAREHVAAQVERARRRQDARDAKEGDVGQDGRASAGPTAAIADFSCVLPVIRGASDLEAPRASIHELARATADSHGLADLVRPCDVGLGFYMDAPEPPDLDGDPPRDGSSSCGDPAAYSGVRLWIWWWLSLCADQLDASHLRAIGERDGACWLFQLFERLPHLAPGKDLLDALYLLVGKPDWPKLSAEFLSNAALADDVFTRLMDLAHRCRALSVAARRSNVSLWVRSP